MTQASFGAPAQETGPIAPAPAAASSPPPPPTSGTPASTPAPASSAPQSPPPAPASSGERPGWLPQKFASPEQLAVAYQELERKLGGQQAPPAAPPPPPPVINQQQTPPKVDAPNAEGPKLDPANAAQALTAAAQELQSKGIDSTKVFKEWVETNGQISAATRQQLNAAGYSDAFISDWVAVQGARNARTVDVMAQSVEGKDNLKPVLDWASKNLDPATARQIQHTIDTGSDKAVQLMMSGLYNQYTAANGKDPTLVGGNGRVAGGAVGYESMAQQKADQADQRYKKDPAFRASVEARIRATKAY